MNELDFRQMMHQVGFAPADARLLRDVASGVREHIPGVVDSFYARLSDDRQAGMVLGSDGRVERLRHILQTWMAELFQGTYDDEYFQRRSDIGRTHVRVSLPQRYMFIGMNLIRCELSRIVASLNQPESDGAVAALNKLLDLDLAVMVEAYREDYIGKIRAADQQSMQQRIDEVEHMASIGQLAASLAHEIKNPLAGISGAIQIMSQELEVGHPHAEIMRQILRQIDRLDSAVKDLLVYARPKPPEPRSCDIGKAILNCLTILNEDPTIKSLDIRWQGLDRGIEAMLDRSQFEQVISNLVLNAAHACAGNGVVNIALGQDDHHVKITIADDGPGMNQDVLGRALEPFFTTKARGTGLGLPICQRIIEAHHGHLNIDTAPQRGTSVDIILPYISSAGRSEDPTT